MMGASVSQPGLSSPTEPSCTVSALPGFDPSRSVVAKLLHPRTGVLRGIFGDEMPAGKGGPDKDGKLLKITVGELREIDRALRLQRAIINDLRTDLALAIEARRAETLGSVEDESAGPQGQRTEGVRSNVTRD